MSNDEFSPFVWERVIPGLSGSQLMPGSDRREAWRLSAGGPCCGRYAAAGNGSAGAGEVGSPYRESGMVHHHSAGRLTQHASRLKSNQLFRSQLLPTRRVTPSGRRTRHDAHVDLNAAQYLARSRHSNCVFQHTCCVAGFVPIAHAVGLRSCRSCVQRDCVFRKRDRAMRREDNSAWPNKKTCSTKAR